MTVAYGGLCAAAHAACVCARGVESLLLVLVHALHVCQALLADVCSQLNAVRYTAVFVSVAEYIVVCWQCVGCAFLLHSPWHAFGGLLYICPSVLAESCAYGRISKCYCSSCNFPGKRARVSKRKHRTTCPCVVSHLSVCSDPTMIILVIYLLFNVSL
jgi:hypothetical protein